MKIITATLLGIGLANSLIIPSAQSAGKLSIEERLTQLELRLQQAESRANIAEQKNVQLQSKTLHLMITAISSFTAMPVQA